MKPAPFIYVFTASAVFAFSCSTASTEKSAAASTDSSRTKMDTSKLVLEESEIVAGSGDLIHLNKGEWYAAGTYEGYDRSRGILIFEQSNGNLREISTNPWNRNGKMQITDNRDIKLTQGQEYEFIYYYQFETQGQSSTRASGFYISDIIPRNFYFTDKNRYVEQLQNKSLLIEKNGAGKYLDDLNGGVLKVKYTDGKIEFLYAATYSGEAHALTYEPYLSKVLITQLPGADAPAYLRFKEGEWILYDAQGKRRVFRPEG